MKTLSLDNKIERNVSGFSSRYFELLGVMLVLLSLRGIASHWLQGSSLKIQSLTEYIATLSFCVFMIAIAIPALYKEKLERSFVTPPRSKLSKSVDVLFAMAVVAMLLTGTTGKFAGGIAGLWLGWTLFRIDVSNPLTRLAGAMAAFTGGLAFLLGIPYDWTLATLSIPCFVVARTLKAS